MVSLRRARNWPWRFWAISEAIPDTIVLPADGNIPEITALDQLLNRDNELTNDEIVVFAGIQPDGAMGSNLYTASVRRGVASATVNMYDLSSLMRSFPWRMPVEFRELTALGSAGRHGERAKPGFEAVCTVLMSYQEKASYDLLVANQEGYRLLYVQRDAAAKHLWAVVQLYDVGGERERPPGGHPV